MLDYITLLVVLWILIQLSQDDIKFLIKLQGTSPKPLNLNSLFLSNQTGLIIIFFIYKSIWCETLLVKPFSGWSKARRESVRNHLWADCSATNNKTRLGFFVIFRRISSIQVFEMNIQSYFLFG